MNCSKCGEEIVDPDEGCPCSEEFNRKFFFCFECGKKCLRTSPYQKYCKPCVKIVDRRRTAESKLRCALRDKDKVKQYAILICVDENCGFKYRIDYDVKKNQDRFRAEKCPKCGKERFPKEPVEGFFKSSWEKCKLCSGRANGSGLCQSHYDKKRREDSHKKTVKKHCQKAKNQS